MNPWCAQYRKGNNTRYLGCGKGTVKMSSHYFVSTLKYSSNKQTKEHIVFGSYYLRLRKLNKNNLKIIPFDEIADKHFKGFVVPLLSPTSNPSSKFCLSLPTRWRVRTSFKKWLRSDNTEGVAVGQQLVKRAQKVVKYHEEKCNPLWIMLKVSSWLLQIHFKFILIIIITNYFPCCYLINPLGVTSGTAD